MIEHLLDLEGEGLALPEWTTFMEPLRPIVLRVDDYEMGVVFGRWKVSHYFVGRRQTEERATCKPTEEPSITTDSFAALQICNEWMASCLLEGKVTPILANPLHS